MKSIWGSWNINFTPRSLGDTYKKPSTPSQTYKASGSKNQKVIPVELPSWNGLRFWGLAMYIYISIRQSMYCWARCLGLGIQVTICNQSLKPNVSKQFFWVTHTQCQSPKHLGLKATWLGVLGTGEINLCRRMPKYLLLCQMFKTGA